MPQVLWTKTQNRYLVFLEDREHPSRDRQSDSVSLISQQRFGRVSLSPLVVGNQREGEENEDAWVIVLWL